MHPLCAECWPQLQLASASRHSQMHPLTFQPRTQQHTASPPRHKPWRMHLPASGACPPLCWRGRWPAGWAAAGPCGAARSRWRPGRSWLQGVRLERGVRQQLSGPRNAARSRWPPGGRWQHFIMGQQWHCGAAVPAGIKVPSSRNRLCARNALAACQCASASERSVL